MAERQQRQVDGVEREVAPEREEPQPGVAVDVAFADLDEPSTERQQFQARALGGADDRVEHDVDAVALGVTADQVGEFHASRVVNMLNAHVAQQLSTLLAAGGGEDLGSRGAGDRDCRLPHAPGCGVDQHLVAAVDAGQLVQAVPGGGGRGGHRGRLRVGQAGRQRDGQARVAGDEGAPAAVGGQAADMVADLVVGHVWSDRGHHPGEIGAQLWQLPLEGGVTAERDQHVGEVDAGRADRDLDLSRPRRNPVAGNKFHRLQIAGCADLQAHPVVLMVGDGGLPLLGEQRSGAQPRGVPRAVSPGGLVFFGPAEQLLRQLLGVGGFVHIDLGGLQVRMFGADHPDQAPQPSLLQVGLVAGQHGLGSAGHDVQARRLARDLWQFAGDAHQMLHILAAQQRGLVIGVAVLRSGEDHHTGESTGTQMASKLFGRSRCGRLCGGQHMVVHCAPWLFSASVNVVATTSAVAVVLISSQVPASAYSSFGQFSLPPFDGQQPLAQHPIVVAVPGDAGAQSQPLHGEQDCPVLVEHVEVGLDPGGVGFGHPRVAVVGVAGRSRRSGVDGHPTATPAHSSPRAWTSG